MPYANHEDALRRARTYYQRHKDEPAFKQKRKLSRQKPITAEKYRVYNREYQAKLRQNPQYRFKTNRRLWLKRLQLFKELGNKCIRCGETDVRLFDLHHNENGVNHHRNPYHYMPKGKEKEELILLCVKCHRLIHWETGKLREVWRNIINV